MRTVYIVGLSLALLANVGCQSVVRMSESRAFPHAPRFTIMPSSETNYRGTLLDFQAVYYLRWDVPRISYNFYRFWPNGRVMTRYTNRLPSSIDAEDFTNAYLGYYELNGSNLKMEFFVPRLGTIGWTYICEYAELKEDKIVVIRGDPLGDPKAFPAVFSKKPIGELKRQADW